MRKLLIACLLLPALFAGCGGGSDASEISPVPPLVSGIFAGDAAVAPSPSPQASGPANVAPLVVDSGPAKNGVNILYTTVTLCAPGSSTQCSTVDHVMVDTGSTGLRILSDAVSSGVNLRGVHNAANHPVFACANFLDGSYAWGPVAQADVKIGGETATGVSVQLVGKSGTENLASACSASGQSLSSVSAMGANGILGVGLKQRDCGVECDPAANNNADNGLYFACSDADCSAVQGTTLSQAQQLQHPVAALAKDNNGLAIVLENVPPAGQASAKGTLVMGVDTQANNKFAGLTTIPTNRSGIITTLVDHGTIGEFAPMKHSFLDTGSNGLFFDSALPVCPGGKVVGFYCPSVSVNASATLGALGGANKHLSFTIGNAETLVKSKHLALPTLGGRLRLNSVFDWGLPLFYGRTVVFGIEGQGSSLGTGPYYAL